MTQQSEKATCGTCAFIGGIAWDNGFRLDYYCGKQKERRRDGFRTTGDMAEDFMQEFRKFYDASVRQIACKYYQERGEISAEEREILKLFVDGKATFKFMTNENRLAEKHNNKFWRSEEYRLAGPMRHYKLTDLGKLEVARMAVAHDHPHP